MNNNEIKELEFEKKLWLVVIFAAALSILGDDLEEHFIIDHDENAEKNAKKIFIFTIVISIFIYLYYVNRNYKQYELSKIKNDGNTTLQLIRLAGSILIVVGVIFILYFEVSEKKPIGSPVI